MSEAKKPHWRRWLLAMLALLLCGLLAVTALVAAVDPFFHYHKPIDGISYTLYNEYYQNFGIVSNFEYDALITGSSVTENFRPSWFDEAFGGSTIKACYAGASIKNVNLLLQKAFKENPDLKRVYWGLDILMMEMDPDYLWGETPMYLYDDNPFNDVRYLFNKYVISTSLATLERTAKGEVGVQSFDDYAYWQAQAGFGQGLALKTYQPYWDPARENDYMRTPQISMEQVRRNLDENILPLITGHPDAAFTLIIPPFSVLFWQARISRGALDATMEMLRLVLGTLLEYDNVEIYSFLDWPEVTANLYHYFDPIHHDAEVNRRMVEAMAEGRFLLDAGNYEAQLENVYTLATGFDYDLFNTAGNPLLGMESLSEYIDYSQPHGQMLLLAAQWPAGGAPGGAVAAQLAQLGLEANFGAEAGGFVAAVRGGQLLAFVAGPRPNASLTVDGLDIELLADPESRTLSLRLDGLEYTRYPQQLAVAVYDFGERRVLDSASFELGSGALIERH